MTAGTQCSAPAPGEVHVWRADLELAAWPAAGRLPDAERRRAAAIVAARRRRRWVASRWALRIALSRYCGGKPEALELRADAAGKPWLADDPELRFSLSHSGELALVAVAAGREVGVDVERHGERPTAFYADWVRREAVGKCFGVGLAQPPSARPVQVLSLELDDGWAAALAVAGTRAPLVLRRELRPVATAARGRP